MLLKDIRIMNIEDDDKRCIDVFTNSNIIEIINISDGQKINHSFNSFNDYGYFVITKIPLFNHNYNRLIVREFINATYPHQRYWDQINFDDFYEQSPTMFKFNKNINFQVEIWDRFENKEYDRLENIYETLTDNVWVGQNPTNKCEWTQQKKEKIIDQINLDGKQELYENFIYDF